MFTDNANTDEGQIARQNEKILTRLTELDTGIDLKLDKGPLIERIG